MATVMVGAANRSQRGSSCTPKPFAPGFALPSVVSDGAGPALFLRNPPGAAPR